jgi:ComF family protein
MGSDTNINADICRTCQQSPPPVDQTLAPFQYAPPSDSLMQGLKFHHRLAHAKLFSQLMTPILKQYYQGQALPGVIIPVPLHPKRLRQRGFNQSIEIAKPLARAFHIPMNTGSCQRIISTKPQSSLDAKNRKTNVRNAFRIKKPLAQKHIAILDDVMTTTSTVGELAVILKDAGVERIDVWCCARA